MPAAEQDAPTATVPEAQPDKVSPVTDIGGWVERREQKQATDKEKPATTEPVLPEPETPQARKFEHGFLKQLKDDAAIEKAFRETEKAKQDAERTVKALERERDQWQRDREADAALARRDAARPQQPDTAATNDQREAEIDQLWFTDPKRARALMDELATERATKLFEEKMTAREQAKATAEFQQSVQQVGRAAVAKVMNDYGIDQNAAEQKMLGVLGHLNAHIMTTGDVTVLANLDNYTNGFRALFGEPPTKEQDVPVTIMPPIVQSAQEPPGIKRAAVPTPRKAETGNPLSEEEKEVRRGLAKEFNNNGISINADRLIKRASR